MERSLITEKELWDYISKEVDNRTSLILHACLNSSDYDKKVFCQVAMIHILSGEIEMATYTFKAARTRLFEFILGVDENCYPSSKKENCKQDTNLTSLDSDFNNKQI